MREPESEHHHDHDHDENQHSHDDHEEHDHDHGEHDHEHDGHGHGGHGHEHGRYLHCAGDYRQRGRWCGRVYSKAHHRFGPDTTLPEYGGGLDRSGRQRDPRTIQNLSGETHQ